MFDKIVAIEPLNITDEGREALKAYARETRFFQDAPCDRAEIIARIGDADCVLVSTSAPVDKVTLNTCKRIRYIGMCCSLYNPQSANVDILEAERLGMVVKGVRDYGDEGVAEYVISELVRYLHGFGGKRWMDKPFPVELSAIRAGIVGLGVTGLVIARALSYFGADISYYSRTRKPDIESAQGYRYLTLDALLESCDAVFTCLTRNTIVLYEREFKLFTGGKILFNTSIAPSHDVAALDKWLDEPHNAFFCDTKGALGDDALLNRQNVHCARQSGGLTAQARVRLSKKVMENMDAFFKGN